MRTPVYTTAQRKLEYPLYWDINRLYPIIMSAASMQQEAGSPLLPSRVAPVFVVRQVFILQSISDYPSRQTETPPSPPRNMNNMGRRGAELTIEFIP